MWGCCNAAVVAKPEDGACPISAVSRDGELERELVTVQVESGELNLISF